MNIITCPVCGVKYWWNRRDRMKFNAGYDVPVDCSCGIRYHIGHGVSETILKVGKEDGDIQFKRKLQRFCRQILRKARDISRGST